MDDRRDVWIAFILSLAVPGAGQLWKRSLWGVFWLGCAAVLLVFWGLIKENVGHVPIQWNIISFLLLGLASGVHAGRIAWRAAEKSLSSGVCSLEEDRS